MDCTRIKGSLETIERMKKGRERALEKERSTSIRSNDRASFVYKDYTKKGAG